LNNSERLSSMELGSVSYNCSNALHSAAVAWVRAQVRSCGISGGRSGTWSRFSSSASVSLANHFNDCSTLITYHPGLVQ
jgi:hypothetical protein